MDLFKWSIPFLMDKVSEIIKALSKKCTLTPKSTKEIENIDFSKMLKDQAMA